MTSDPICCYCGVRATETIDHAPARACFKNNEAPEGYESPACVPCNGALRKTENIVALYIKLADRTPENFSFTDQERLRLGVRNNAPECLPGADLSANQRRRAYQMQGLRLAPGETFAEAPVARVPKPVQAHMRLFARKMLAALFYRETGRILGTSHALITEWFQAGSPASVASSARAQAWFGKLIVGKRQNINIGRQFVYRVGYSANHGFFGLWMEFGTLQFFCVAGPADQLATLETPEHASPWLPLDEAARVLLLLRA